VAQGEVSVRPHPSSSGTPFSSNQEKADSLIGAAALKAKRRPRRASATFRSFCARATSAL